MTHRNRSVHKITWVRSKTRWARRRATETGKVGDGCTAILWQHCQPILTVVLLFWWQSLTTVEVLSLQTDRKSCWSSLIMKLSAIKSW